MNLNHFSNILRDAKASESDKMDAFKQFYEYYSSLVKGVLKKQKFSERQLSKDIFRANWSGNESETIFKKHLFSSFQTLERIKAGMEDRLVRGYKLDDKQASINNFADFLFVFSFDVYGLVKHAEEKYNKRVLDFQMGSRITSSPQEIFENANIMLHIKNFGSDSIHYRDFFSYTVFAIRLMIEVAGKTILGFSSITDKKGDRVLGIRTQIAWHFIRQDQSSNKRIKLPLDIDTVLQIEKWTNQFIHTGDVQPIFLVENALAFIDRITLPGKIEIAGYGRLKTEFEEFAQSKAKKKVVINWNTGKNMEPRIITI